MRTPSQKNISITNFRKEPKWRPNPVQNAYKNQSRNQVQKSEQVSKNIENQCVKTIKPMISCGRGVFFHKIDVSVPELEKIRERYQKLF